jgi:hypothetical protein
MQTYEKYKVDMLKIIIIIIGYTLNNFTTHITIFILSIWKLTLGYDKYNIYAIITKHKSIFMCCNECDNDELVQIMLTKKISPQHYMIQHVFNGDLMVVRKKMSM